MEAFTEVFINALNVDAIYAEIDIKVIDNSNSICLFTVKTDNVFTAYKLFANDHTQNYHSIYLAIIICFKFVDKHK